MYARDIYTARPGDVFLAVLKPAYGRHRQREIEIIQVIEDPSAYVNHVYGIVKDHGYTVYCRAWGHMAQTKWFA